MCLRVTFVCDVYVTAELEDQYPLDIQETLKQEMFMFTEKSNATQYSCLQPLRQDPLSHTSLTTRLELR